VYAGKVQPITAVAKALFDVIKADKPLGLDDSSLEGAHGGSTEDPNAPAPSTAPTPTATADPDATPAVEAVVVPGVKGQTAAQYTCSVANN
jgi:hypothetical protein